MAARQKKVTAVSIPAYASTWAQQPGNAPLLLTSPESTVLQETAHTIAAAILCGKNQEIGRYTAPCGACRHCRLLSAGNHPDFHQLQTDKATWTIKDFRSLFREISITPAGKRRVVVINDIEKASFPAANTLLKSLEEPRGSSSFVLTTRWPRRVLPTVLSRCYQVRLAYAAKTPDTVDFSTIESLSLATLDEETLPHIIAYLEQALRTQGPTLQLKRAYMRLRDYYFITSRRGNSKLAGEVLLLSVPPNGGM